MAPGDTCRFHLYGCDSRFSYRRPLTGIEQLNAAICLGRPRKKVKYRRNNFGGIRRPGDCDVRLKVIIHRLRTVSLGLRDVEKGKPAAPTLNVVPRGGYRCLMAGLPPQVPSSVHVPVMAEEVMRHLNPEPGALVVDGTLGGGGHTRLLAEAVGPTGRVIALDKDPAAVDLARERIALANVTIVHASYADIPQVLQSLELEPASAVLLDLGLSSDQLADTERGFGIRTTGKLDLRFDPTVGEPAWRLLQFLRERDLADLIFEHGEERFSRRIARAIVERRKTDPVKTAEELAELVRRCVPFKRQQRIHPATRTFQALRIAVNDELAHLETALRTLPEGMQPGGRLAIISFHSLEDRRVKHAFRQDERFETISRKPIRPTEEEVSRNPCARSARLRITRIASTKPA